jgi:hypothetical protein
MKVFSGKHGVSRGKQTGRAAFIAAQNEDVEKPIEMIELNGMKSDGVCWTMLDFEAFYCTHNLKVVGSNPAPAPNFLLLVQT